MLFLQLLHLRKGEDQAAYRNAVAESEKTLENFEASERRHFCTGIGLIAGIFGFTTPIDTTDWTGHPRRLGGDAGDYVNFKASEIRC